MSKEIFHIMIEEYTLFDNKIEVFQRNTNYLLTIEMITGPEAENPSLDIPCAKVVQVPGFTDPK